VKLSDLHIPPRLKSLPGWLAAVLVVLGTLTGLFTFLVLTRLTPIEPTESIVRALLYANGVLVCSMAALVAGQILALIIERRRGTPGSGLHTRLVSLFSLIAALPAILVAVFATVTLNRGLDSWFSERTQAIVDTATTVAEAYVTNASEATRADAANIANDLVQQKDMFDKDKPNYVRRVARHAAIRNLAAAFVLDEATKRIEVNVTANDKIKFIAPTADVLAKASDGEAVLIAPGRGGNLVRAVSKLQGYPDHYLYVYRVISPVVMDQLVKTQDAKAEYDALMRQRLGVQLTYGLVFALVALVFLLAAIWSGLWFSNRLVSPLVDLLAASRQIADGKFDARVPSKKTHADLKTLIDTFNLMSEQVQEQRQELLSTNEQLDARRRVMEAVLSGVSAGVVGITQDHRVSLVNRSAAVLLGRRQEDILGKPIEDVHPDFAVLYVQALSRTSGSAVGKVDTVVRGREVSFLVRITTERADSEQHGFVLTFDDITDLVSAQRNSAWADIARRIAHEIKNPLTPIQLSAERLKRKYSKEIRTDRKVFEQCTDTIIRQVGDLGRIVDEFSSFARMPKAAPEPNPLGETVRDATVLQRVSSSDISIELDLPQDDFSFPFDRRLVTQAITNMVKNGREAIEARQVSEPQHRGRIVVSAGMDGVVPFISVTDNGVGLPGENRHRLAEPYMTTREKGTGLGLAIVKRIMEEHGGSLELEDAPDARGARITLRFAALEHSKELETAEMG
jgi:two-component system, NtrC family, nitrogen regulation sensor histidine kinase NtrY